MIEPTIFLGPPGTGKTTTLLDTVDMEMSNGIPPDRIGFMTFTKRGVEEAVSRAAEKFRLPRREFRFFNTLHAAAFRYLGLNMNQVFTGKRVSEFGREHGLDLRGEVSLDDGTYTSFFGDDLILFLENFARITCTDLGIILRKYDHVLPDTERAWQKIQELYEHKKKLGLFDFTDMIEEFIKGNDPPRLEVLIIDEAQDLSALQWKMVDLLSRHAKRVYVAGDDDQTIFTWAGASEHFITMAGNVRLLDQSFRVPIKVHELANRVIRRVSQRRSKNWMPRDFDGSLKILEEIGNLDPGELKNESVMMLGRTVKLLRKKFVLYCRTNGIPYRYFDANSIKPSIATAIIAWQKLQEGGDVSASSISKIYDLLPSESHGQKAGVARGGKVRLTRIADQPEPPLFTMEELRRDYGLQAQGDWADVFVQIPPEDIQYIARVLANGYNLQTKPNIHISTIHRVKGGQADKVILLTDTAKAIERLSADNRDEEIRVFYTGITRTFRELTIVQPGGRHQFGEIFE